MFDLLLLVMAIPSMLIPALHIPSLYIEPVRAKAFTFGDMAYMGSLYMIVLLSYERYVAVYQKRELTMKRTVLYIVFVTIFSILYNLPKFWLYVLKTDEDGNAKTKRSDFSCTEMFYKVYFVGLNACFRFIGPTLCLIGFNIFIYKEVI